MTNITLTSTWQEIVAAGSNYLVQSVTGGEFLVVDAAAQPTTTAGFSLNKSDSLSSVVYPSTNGIWARARNTQVSIVVDTWA